MLSLTMRGSKSRRETVKELWEVCEGRYCKKMRG